MIAIESQLELEEKLIVFSLGITLSPRMLREENWSYQLSRRQKKTSIHLTL